MFFAQLNAVRYQEISHPEVATRNCGCDRRRLRVTYLRGLDPRPGLGNFRQSLPEPHRFSLAVQMPSAEEPPAKDADPHTLLVFLQSQPKKALSRLYQRPSSCLCIFRFLLYSCLVRVTSTDAWDNCCLCYKIAWAARKANRYEYSLAGCLDTCLYYVLLGRARG